MMRRILTTLSLAATLFLTFAPSAQADGPGDNAADKVRRIPKLGVEVPAEKRAELEKKIAALGQAIEEIRKQATSKKDEKTLGLLPDLIIYHKAAHDALKYQEFFDVKEIDKALSLLDEGQKRAEQLAKGEHPWTTAKGLVLRGYVSKIDGSVQPYGLVVPESYTPEGANKYRLDLWFHGRGETLSEVNFLEDRRKSKGTFTPADTIVLHPYGRYCNANKFAGEIDGLEGIASVESRYRIDPDRISVRGFSMGGAACWQMAVHYPTRWFAANPGAGFSETPLFLKVFQNESLAPTWYEKKLWQMHDCNGWAINLSMCPTVAYSGEEDNQKQAADVMEKALADLGMKLVHIIGPKTKHSYEPKARETVDRLMAEHAVKGRERVPRNIKFTTFTLRYPDAGWVRVEGLAEHWNKAHVEGTLGNEIELKTENITELSLNLPAGAAPADAAKGVIVAIDGQRVTGPPPRDDRSWEMRLAKVEGKWQPAKPEVAAMKKKPGLQGPIDDAFMDSFIFVKPSGKCANEKVEKWVHAEMDRAIEHWRRHFRGEARVKLDSEVTPEDIANSNLVLWGDPSANSLLAKIAGKLPIQWQGDQLAVGVDQKFPAAHHAPVLIYPNPLNPEKYVVLNSSFTFRDYDYLNNARQVSKLPDWAIVDLDTPPGSRYPGKIVAADFFGEKWELKPAQK